MPRKERLRIRKIYLLIVSVAILTQVCLMPKQAVAPELPEKKQVLARAIPSISRGEEPKIEKKIMQVTAYTDGKESTGKTPSNPNYGQTAISTPTHKVFTKKWYTVAAPYDIPIGTEIYIPYFADKPNHGIFVVEDRGGAIKGNKLDVYFGDPAKDKTVLPSAYDFGVQDLEVFIQYYERREKNEPI